MQRLLVATQNPGKVREYAQMLGELPLQAVGLRDVGLGEHDVEETGATFAENAILKARYYAQAAGLLALADDSGLVVDALDGAPGVYSARYGGPGLDDAGRRQKLLQALADVPPEKRSARFVCVIALAHPPGEQVQTVEGRVEGQILLEERDGGYGFGYDALFCPQGHTRTFAELEPEIKNRISHRGQALARLRPLLQKLAP